MATRTVKASAGSWNAIGTWVENQVPTAADDVVTDGSSTGTLTINASGLVCRSLTIANSVAVTFSSGSSLLIGDASGGAMNLTGMGTLTLSGGTLSFVSTSTNSGNGWNITTAGKALPNTTFVGVGGQWKLLDAFAATGNSITVTSGIFNGNGQTITCGTFSSSGALARTVDITNCSITASSSATAWGTGTTTNLTFTSTGSTITLTGSSPTFAGGGLSFATVSITGPGTTTMTGANSFVNLTRTGTALKTDGMTLGADITVTTTLTLTGNTVTNRLFVRSGTVGTPRTITCNTTVTVSNVDFTDIIGAGTASWNLVAVSSGDAGGNSGITFTVAAAQTWNGTSGGNWSANAWTSRVPLPQDDVTIASAFSASQTVTADMPRLGKSITWSGSSGSPTWSFGVANTIYGSVTLITGMTISGTSTTTFAGRDVHTLTSAGRTWTQALTFIITVAPNGFTLQDALITNGALTITSSRLDAGNQNVTCLSFTSTGLSGLTMGSGTWTLTGTSGTVWSWASGGGLALLTRGTSTIVISGATSNTRTFVGAGATYYNLTYNVAGSTGPLVITGANTFATITAGPGITITFPSATTTTVSTLSATGVANGYLRLPGLAANYVSTADSAALSFTGDFDLRVRLAMDDWTPAAESTIMSKATPTSNQLSWLWTVNSATGRLKLYVSATGSSYGANATSSASPVIADGATLWVRVTWRASDGRVQFFTASGATTNPTAGDFTQLGTDQTASVASIFNSTAPVEISTSTGGAAGMLAGNYYRAQIRDGLDGTVVYDADFVGKAIMADTFTESSAQAATVTINGSLAKAGDGRVSFDASSAGSAATLSMPADQIVRYVMIKDSTATGGYRYGAARSNNVSGNTGWVFASEILQPSGSITPSGALAKTDNKAATGSVTPTGTCVRSAGKGLSGSCTPTGGLTKAVARALAGTITPSGALANQIGKAMAGTVSPAGTLTKDIGKALAGSLTPTGSLVRSIAKTLAGSVTPAGALAKQAGKTLAGTVTPVGALGKATTKRLTGSVTPTGSLVRTIGKALAGLINPAGGLTIVAVGGVVIDIVQPTYGVLVTTGATSGTLVSDSATSGVLVSDGAYYGVLDS